MVCQFCHSRLGIRRTDSAVATEVLDQIHENTTRLTRDVEILKLQNELEQLDREWATEREQFLDTGKNGAKTEPGGAGQVIMGIVGVGFLLFWIGGAINMGAPIFFPIAGIVGLVLLIAGTVNSQMKANGLTVAEQEYKDRRAKILRKISAAKSESRS